MTTRQHEYDVCLSFAGEQRNYVDRVAELLTENGVHVFYDKYEQANLWGKDLYEHLDSVYREKARYCVIFISSEYAAKVWTNHERKSAQARALQENQEYVLPVRFDDTEIPGIRPTVGYIDIRTSTVDQLVAHICAKLDSSDASQAGELPATYTGSGAPRTQEEQDLLIQSKPPGWEYMLFAWALTQGRESLKPKYRDHQLRYARTVRRLADDDEALDFISDAMARAGKMIGDGIERVLDPSAQEWAFGAPGAEGEVDKILHLGQRFIQIYEDMFDWSADLRGTVTSDRFEKAFDLAASFMDEPINQVDQFIDNYRNNLEGVPDRLANGEVIELELKLTVTIDERVSEAFRKEMKRVTPKFNWWPRKALQIE